MPLQADEQLESPMMTRQIAKERTEHHHDRNAILSPSLHFQQQVVTTNSYRAPTHQEANTDTAAAK